MQTRRFAGYDLSVLMLGTVQFGMPYGVANRIGQPSYADVRAMVAAALEGGVNCMFPVEVAAGSDPIELRERFGHDILLAGGVNKRELAKDKQAIEREVHRLLPLVEDGGFIPHVDHRCPDGVAFEMYQYYIREKLHFLGWPQDEIEQIPGLQTG